jgi:hypothetical protein
VRGREWQVRARFFPGRAGCGKQFKGERPRARNGPCDPFCGVGFCDPFSVVSFVNHSVNSPVASAGLPQIILSLLPTLLLFILLYYPLFTSPPEELAPAGG